MLPCSRKITKGSVGQTYDPPLPALKCADCGRLQVNARMIESSRRITLPPPPDETPGRMRDEVAATN